MESSLARIFAVSTFPEWAREQPRNRIAALRPRAICIVCFISSRTSVVCAASKVQGQRIALANLAQNGEGAGFCFVPFDAFSLASRLGGRDSARRRLKYWRSEERRV